MSDSSDRRAFLRAVAAAGAAWAAADLLGVEAALAWAARQTAGGPASPETQREFAALTPEQARTLDAATSRIIPSLEGRPGAREAGVVYFIDRSLATFNGQQKASYIKGIRDLDRRAGRTLKNTRSTFASLAPDQQDGVLRAIEKTPFFHMIRLDTIVGTLALPTYGGNRDHAGWRMIGLSHQPVFQPPFGYYDADVNRRS